MQQTLFLMLGYPGAGKTTIARLIHKQTGAVHLWADQERKKRFATPTYTHQENMELYTSLNNLTDQLLGEGKSIIFDTNFNFYKDRQKLRALAAKHGAKSVVVWLSTPRDIARNRAIQDAHKQDTRILGNMQLKEFERMSDNLQPPRANEHVIELNGQGVTPEIVAKALAKI